MKVLLVDDHPVVRAGLVALLSGEGDIEVIGESADAADAVRRAAMDLPDIVLMDLQLAGGTHGIEAIKRIRALRDPPEIIVLTNYESDADIVRAIDAGAIGYLLKSGPPEELFHALRSAMRGETVLSPPVAGRMMRLMRTPDAALSPREIEILQLLARGLSNREIARELFITEATVKTHLVNIFGKLGVETRTAAVTTAAERGLIRLA